MEQLRKFNKHYFLISWIISWAFVFLPSTNFAKETSSSPQSKKTVIEVSDKQFQLDGKGKTAKAFDVLFIHPDGSTSREGYFGVKGQLFNVMLVNKTAEPITLHWHGLIVPNDQDGVPGVTQTPIQPGESRPYQYKLVQSGTYWMHSHEGFQEQQQLSAPFIIYEPGNPHHEQEIIMFLQDFTYQDPNKIFQKLRSTNMTMQKNSMNMQNSTNMKMSMPTGMTMGDNADYNDIDYDAFLTNKATLANPQIKTVTAGQQVRIRIINAAASTNFEINLGTLQGTLVAVDGEDIKPIKGNQFPIGIGNRLDILVTIPQKGGAFPILAQAEGTNKQTGLIIATSKASITQLSTTATQKTGRIPYYELEKQLNAVKPLATKK